MMNFENVPILAILGSKNIVEKNKRNKFGRNKIIKVIGVRL